MTEIIEHFGIRLRLDEAFMSHKLIEAIRTKRYEAAEARGIRRFLQPGDTILEIGAGIGFVTALMLKNPTVARVVSFEANPLLIPKIQRTLSDNGLGHQRFELHNAVLGREETGTVDFHVHRDFWASSLRRTAGTVETRQVPLMSFDKTISRLNAWRGPFWRRDARLLLAARHRRQVFPVAGVDPSRWKAGFAG